MKGNVITTIIVKSMHAKLIYKLIFLNIKGEPAVKDNVTTRL